MLFCENFQNCRVLTNKYRNKNLIKNLSAFNLNNKKIRTVIKI